MLGVAQPPGQLDLAPDRDAALAGLGQQWGVGAPAGRGDEHVDVVGQHRRGALAQADGGAEHLEQLGLLLLARGGLVEGGDGGAEVVEVVGGGEAGDAEAGDDRAHAVPGAGLVEAVEVAARAHVPATHSA